MTIVTLRKIHRILGVVFAPFLLITAVTGGILLWRRADIYDYQTTAALLKWHNWEGLHAIGIHYLGVVLAAGLVGVVLSGAALWVWIRIRTRRSRRTPQPPRT